MRNEDHWASILVVETRKLFSLVTDRTSVRLEQQLKGPFSERTLPSTDIRNVAKALIEDMMEVSPDTEATQ